MLGRGEMVHQRLAKRKGKPTVALRLVDPVRAVADRAFPLQRSPAMTAPGRTPIAAPPGSARSLPSSCGNGAAGRRHWSTARRARPGSRPPGHRRQGLRRHRAELARHAQLSGRPGRSADRPAPSRSPGGGLLDQRPAGSRVEPGQCPGARRRSRRRTSPRPRASASGRTAPGPWAR